MKTLHNKECFRIIRDAYNKGYLYPFGFHGWENNNTKTASILINSLNLEAPTLFTRLFYLYLTF